MDGIVSTSIMELFTGILFALLLLAIPILAFVDYKRVSEERQGCLFIAILIVSIIVAVMVAF